MIDDRDRFHRSFVRSSLSLSLAPRDGPLARASTLDAFDDTVRPRASAASADDGARESDVDGLRNCAQLGPERRHCRHDNRRVMTHEEGTLYWPPIQKRYFSTHPRARVSVCCLLSVYLSLRCERAASALRYEFSSSRGSVARTTSTVNATAGGSRAATASPRAADEDADVARSSPRTRARTPSARRPPRMMPA